jgi:hypothetical protein
MSMVNIPLKLMSLSLNNRKRANMRPFVKKDLRDDP